MKQIKVLLSGCQCNQKFYDLVVKVATENQLDADIQKVDDIMEIMQYDTMTLPAIVIDGQLVAKGNKNEEQLKAILL